MSWLSKKLKKLKVKDLVKGVKTVASFVPGGALIKQGIEVAERNIKAAKKDVKDTKAVDVKTSATIAGVAPVEGTKSNLLIYAIIGLAIFVMFRK